MSLNFYQFNPYVSDDPDSPAPHPVAPTPTSELIERHARLVAVGLPNCRAAQGLRREIQRRQVLERQQPTPQPPLLANDYDPDERRDDDGKWTAGAGHTGTFATKAAEIPEQHSGIFATIGKALQKAGEKVRDEVAAAMFEVAGDPQDALKQLGYTAEDLKRMGYTDVEPDTGEKPFEQGMQMLPPVQHAVAKAAEGIVISTPKLAIAAVDPLAGVLAFGSTPEGFDLKQAVLAWVLPEIGEAGGEIAESIAVEAGISSQAALQLLNKLGGAAAVAGAIGLDELQQILKLPPEQRKQALLDAAANAGSMLVLGMLGGKKERPEPYEPKESPIEPTEYPQEKPSGEVELQTHEIKQPEPVQKPPPLSAAERQALEADIAARKSLSMDTVARAESERPLDLPKDYVMDPQNHRLLYEAPDNPVATGDAPGKISEQSAEAPVGMPPEQSGFQQPQTSAQQLNDAGADYNVDPSGANADVKQSSASASKQPVGKNLKSTTAVAKKKASVAEKKKGSYVHTFESKTEYVGKGTVKRMKESGRNLAKQKNDKLGSSTFKPANPNTDRQALIDEANTIEQKGGIPNPKLYNKINSPGKKLGEKEGRSNQNDGGAV